MDIEDALDQLGRQIGITLRLDAARACRLVFDGRTALDIEAPADRPGTVFLHSAVGVLPPAGRREAVYETLLAGNLFGRDTGRATLGLDRDLGEILLVRQLDMAETTYAAFVDAVEEHVARTKAWTERLRQAPAAAPAEDALALAQFGLRI